MATTEEIIINYIIPPVVVEEEDEVRFPDKPEAIEDSKRELATLVQAELRRLKLDSGSYLAFRNLNCLVKQYPDEKSPSVFELLKHCFCFCARPEPVWYPLISDISGLHQIPFPSSFHQLSKLIIIIRAQVMYDQACLSCFSDLLVCLSSSPNLI